MTRFYPECIPPFPNEPLKRDFTIVSTAEFGEGIVSQAYFNPGDIVFAFTGEIDDNISLYSLQVEPGVHIHDPHAMGKVLHRCDPNMICNMKTFTFIASKHIAPGDFLSMDYESTEDALYRAFQCGCGAESCRGSILGKELRYHKTGNESSIRIPQST